MRPIFRCDAWTAVQNTDRALPIDLDNYFGLRRGMHERIFNEIAKRIGDCRGVTRDDDRMIGAGQRDRPAA